MRAGRLSYDGTTYTLSVEDVERLLGRGLIVPDAMSRDSYDLAPEHLIEELGDLLVVSRRTGADARGEGTDVGRQRMIAVRFMHRDGQGRG
ncbi:MAG TPA: hypothetical protein VFP19_09125 [Candidatus Limnocylindrales bacterium]|nr:hypothetical protein [Candidatus Limnocylindrales bacterium]